MDGWKDIKKTRITHAIVAPVNKIHELGGKPISCTQTPYELITKFFGVHLEVKTFAIAGLGFKNPWGQALENSFNDKTLLNAKKCFQSSAYQKLTEWPPAISDPPPWPWDAKYIENVRRYYDVRYGKNNEMKIKKMKQHYGGMLYKQQCYADVLGVSLKTVQRYWE